MTTVFRQLFMVRKYVRTVVLPFLMSGINLEILVSTGMNHPKTGRYPAFSGEEFRTSKLFRRLSLFVSIPIV